MITPKLTPARPPILFADLQPDVSMGMHTDIYDQAMSDRWRSIFSDNGVSAAQQASIALVLSMRALLSVVAPRPPGNVHARQQIVVHALPQVGETIHSEVICLNKFIKRERLYVDFVVRGLSTNDQMLYEAQMSLIWAA